MQWHPHKTKKKNLYKKKRLETRRDQCKILRLMPFPHRSSSVAVDGQDRGSLLSSKGGGAEVGAEVGVVGGVARFDRKFKSFWG